MGIEQYQNSFNQYNFKECLIEKYEDLKIKNPFYYETIIKDWYSQNLEKLKNNNKLKEHFVLLNNYLKDIKFLFVSVIELYEAVERYNNIKVRLHRFHIKEYEVIKHFEHLQDVNIIVREYINKGFESSGSKIKDYILLKLDEVILIIKQAFYIEILKSPLKKTIDETINFIKASTDQIENIKSIPEDEYKEYFEVTTLFAQGFIKKDKIENNNYSNIEKCSFKNKNFNNYSELENYLHQQIIPKNKLGKKINIRQYLRHTLSDNKAERNNKNLYFKTSIINKTYEYCKRKGIKMTDEFQQKRIELNN